MAALITKLRDDMNGHVARLSADTAKLRDDLGGEIANARSDTEANFARIRDGLGNVREGLAEMRGELRGVNRSLQDLREDSRVHVYGGAASA